ncbi:hypothetical protein [Nereida sp. MMG025]|uniref:hypothetical protein n=1 Tax=Nereida sp. MMG025 TaxID=2909981 RepID=UPI001F334268|nr:hypothetical protein [Nereida sp. MMG025]MCF6445192.1 hypothetical protein [Nereida sp. MMG025]
MNQLPDTHQHILARHTIPVCSIIGLGSLAMHIFLLQDVSHVVAAILLATIVGVYIGFAANDGRMSHIVVEATVACLFAAFATWALITAPLLLPLGYIAHAG